MNIMLKCKLFPIILITSMIFISVVLYVINAVEYNSCITKQNRLSKVGPTIVLKGGQSIKLNLLDQFSEPGFSATDATDGNLTEKVVTSNTIKTNKIGKYSVTYSVKDKDGHIATSKRDIEIMPPTTNNTSGIPILMYHFFYDSSKGETPADSNFIDINVFDQQLSYLKDNNYYFPTWTELSDYLDGKMNLPQKSIILTADDGSPTFFNKAYPILAKYQIPATSFLITSWSGDTANFNVDKNIISFQSHSNNMHRGGCDTGHGGIFQCIDYQEGYNDLIASKTILGSSDAFCYPFGDYNDAAKQLLRDTGFKVAVTTEYGFAKIGMDKLALPRIRVQGTADLADFVSSIE